jgi:uncharacterized protein YecE (DUF72 family)
MPPQKTKIYIGTSGWVYDDWVDGIFYPSDLRKKDWLKFYSQNFLTVEINATFYHQMPASAFNRWRQLTPPSFIFSVKISRFLTHIKKLNDPREPWQRFITNARQLREKLGPILVQLPPNFKANAEKLKNFLKIIPRSYQIALEVRHESWFNEEIYKILKKHNTALVFADSEEWPQLRQKRWCLPITADFIYIRLHGPGNLYDSQYTPTQLRRIADRIKKWRIQVKTIYIYFNNDSQGYAIKNAQQLIKMILP